MSRETIEGWDSFAWVYDEWLASQPRPGAIVVEVGVGIGRSLSYIADKLIVARRFDVELWAVDPWGGFARNGQQQRMADAAGGDFSFYAKTMLEHDPPAFEFARVIRATSARASRLFDDASLDLVTIDGDHSYAAVTTDIGCWRPKLRPDGWIGGDDYEPRGEVQRAVLDVFGQVESRPPPAGAPWTWSAWLKRPAGTSR